MLTGSRRKGIKLSAVSFQRSAKAGLFNLKRGVMITITPRFVFVNR